MPLSQIVSASIEDGAVAPVDLSSVAQYTGFKNRLINGELGIWQRGTTTATFGAYMADRFWGSTVGTGTYAYARDTNVPSGFQYSSKLSNTVITSAQYLRLNQNIESVNINDLVVGDTFTVSFWARSSNNEGTINTFYGIPTTVDNFGALEFPSNTTGASNSVTSTWTFYKQTYTVVASASGYTPANGLQIIFSYSPATTGSREVQITGLQLEKGVTATSFDYRPYGTELVLCQRYYQQMTATEYYSALQGMAILAGIIWFPFTFPVIMRISPSCTFTGAGTDYWLQYSAGTGSATAVPTWGVTSGKGGYIDARNAGIAAGTPVQLLLNNSTFAGGMRWSAEL